METTYVALTKEGTIPAGKFEITSGSESDIIATSDVPTPMLTAVQLPSSGAGDVLLLSVICLSAVAAVAVRKLRSLA